MDRSLAGALLLVVLGLVVVPSRAEPVPNEATTSPVLPRIDSQARLTRWIGRWPNMRMGHPHEVWVEDTPSSHGLRSRPECLEELRAAGVTVVPADPSPLVAAAVTIRGEVAGVRFQDGHGKPLTYACDMVSRVVRFARIAHEMGIVRIVVASGHRDQPRVSFHTLGLAMDVSRYLLADGSDLRVLRDYERTPDRPTCTATLRQPKAQLLQRLACALHDRRVFSSVLTPNYNQGHHDHMHLDWRPGDARFYVR